MGGVLNLEARGVPVPSGVAKLHGIRSVLATVSQKVGECRPNAFWAVLNRGRARLAPHSFFLM